MSYWDAACLIKLYVEEPDSAVFLEYASRGVVATSGEFARLEFIVTVKRKEADGQIAPGSAKEHIKLLDDAIESGVCRWTAVDDEVRAEFERVVERCYTNTPPVVIRTLDALHIAEACAAGETEIVATDRRLRDAALLLGFRLFPAPTP